MLYKFLQKYKLRKRAHTKFLPYQANIELTTACNLKCYFCPHTFGNIKQEHIKWEILEKYVNDLKEFDDISVIVPVGLGEPFLYPRWEEAFRLIKKEFPNVPFNIVTNGTIMYSDKIEKICEIFTDTDSVLISLNTWDKDTYKKMMGKDHFDKVVQNIQSLVKRRDEVGKKFAIKVQLIKTPDISRHTISDFKYYWSRYLHASRDMPLYLRRLENWGGKGDYKTLGEWQWNYRYPCYALWSIIMVDLHGNVYPCCEALSDREKSSLVLGNIMSHKSLKDIYRGFKYHWIQNDHLTRRWNCYPECDKCDFWYSSPNIWYRWFGRFI